MIVDWTINLGNILTILSLVVCVIVFVVTLSGKIDVINIRIGNVERITVEQTIEIKQLSAILITLGRYEERFLRLEKMVDELRHGVGLIKHHDQNKRIT